jgi:hypothetical protein
MATEQNNINKSNATTATNRSAYKSRTPGRVGGANMVSKVTRARRAAAVMVAWAQRRDSWAINRFPEQAATHRHCVTDVDKVKKLTRARHAFFGRASPVFCERVGGARLILPAGVAARNKVIWEHRNRGTVKQNKTTPIRRHSIKDVDKVKKLTRARHAFFGRAPPVFCGRDGGARLKSPAKVAARNQVLWAHRYMRGPGVNSD